MGQRRNWSERENEILIERRKSKIPFREIAAELGRNNTSVYGHWLKLKAKGSKGRVSHKRKNKKGVAVEMVANQNQEAAKSRPMFALVGERSEIAQTLRELFS